MNTLNTFELLKKFEDNNFNKQELNDFIKYCFNISYSSIKRSYSKKLIPSFTDKQTLEDLAIDSIVPLFTSHGTNRLGILKALDGWKSPITDNIESDYFVLKLVWKRTDQTVTKFLKELDPVFGKVLKTLNLCIATNSIKKIRYFGTVYIVEETVHEISDCIPENDFLDRVPYSILKYTQLELFNALFAYIKEETDYFPAIPLNLLVKKIREMHAEQFNIETKDYADHSDEFIYDSLLKKEMGIINKNIYSFYLPQKRINEEEAEYILASFNDISADLLNGGVHSSLYDYLKFRNNELTREEFYSKYHNIMNYLYKRLKSNLTKQLG